MKKSERERGGYGFGGVPGADERDGAEDVREELAFLELVIVLHLQGDVELSAAALVEVLFLLLGLVAAAVGGGGRAGAHSWDWSEVMWWDLRIEWGRRRIEGNQKEGLYTSAAAAACFSVWWPLAGAWVLDILTRRWDRGRGLVTLPSWLIYAPFFSAVIALAFRY